jgi:hypothetical protein
MKQTQNQSPIRRLASRALALVALGQLFKDESLAYWDHAVTGKLGGRSQFGFDVHKAHLKNIKNARRR